MENFHELEVTYNVLSTRLRLFRIHVYDSTDSALGSRVRMQNLRVNKG